MKSLQEQQSEVQELAIFALSKCKDGETTYANQLIQMMAVVGLFRTEMLIFWFEKFGKLKWSNKKKRLVFSNSGKWAISSAVNTNWFDIAPKAMDLSDLGAARVSDVRPDHFSSTIDQGDFNALIAEYISTHPLETSDIGKFGLPADKNRWGKYKIRIKRP